MGETRRATVASKPGRAGEMGKPWAGNWAVWVEATPRPPNLQGFRLPDRVAAHPHPSLSLGPNCS